MVNSDKGETKTQVRGCLRNKRGPWLIRRATKKGTITSLRNPSDQERENNKNRERTRRKITSNIFAGLRAYGGYDLPSNVDNNRFLVALCEEAGWLVQEDGTISRKLELKVNAVSIDDDKSREIDPLLRHVDGVNNVDLTLSLY